MSIVKTQEILLEKSKQKLYAKVVCLQVKRSKIVGEMDKQIKDLQNQILEINKTINQIKK